MVSRLRGGTVEASLDGDGLGVARGGSRRQQNQKATAASNSSQLMSRARTGRVEHDAAWKRPTPRAGGSSCPLRASTTSSPRICLTALVEPTEYDLGKTEGVVEHPPLSPLATEKTMYLRNDSSRAPATSTRWSPRATTPRGRSSAAALDFLGCDRATSSTSCSTRRSGSPPPRRAPRGFTLWQQGSPLSLVSVLPNGTPAPSETASPNPRSGPAKV